MALDFLLQVEYLFLHRRFDCRVKIKQVPPSLVGSLPLHSLSVLQILPTLEASSYILFYWFVLAKADSSLITFGCWHNPKSVLIHSPQNKEIGDLTPIASDRLHALRGAHSCLC